MPNIAPMPVPAAVLGLTIPTPELIFDSLPCLQSRTMSNIGQPVSEFILVRWCIHTATWLQLMNQVINIINFLVL